MRRHPSLIWLFALVWVVLPTDVASAGPIIDDFTTPLSVPGGEINNAGTSTEFNVPGLFGVGTTDRTTTVTTIVLGTGLSSTSINTVVQRFSHQDVPDAQFKTDIAYTDFGTLDLTNMVIDLPFFQYNDGTNDANLQVTVTLSTPSGLLMSSQTVLSGNTGPFTLTFPFSGFTGPGNITQVQGVTFSFLPQGTMSGPPLGTGFILDGAAGVQINAIPEPASLATWGMLALAGAWFGRRQLQRGHRAA